MSQIETLEALTGEKDEEVLSALLLRAKQFILAETNRTQLTPQLEGIQLEVALELYNRQGSEGEKSRSEGGITVVYQDNLAPHLLSTIRQYRLARVAGHAFEKKPS